MKKATKTGKRVLSVFLAVLMALTSWAFFVPEKAAAAVSGKTYSYAVTFEVTNDMDNVCMIFELFGRTNNGTGGETLIASGQWKDKDTSTTTYTVLSGTTGNYVFPTRLVLRDRGDKYYIDRTLKMNVRLYINGGTKYLHAAKISTGRGSYDWRSGDPAYFAWNSKSGAKVNNYNIQYSVDSGSYPVVSRLDWDRSDIGVTVPKSGTAGASTSSATFADQYNVEWYQEPKYSLRTDSTESVSNSDPVTGVSLSTYDNADKTTLQVQNSAKDWVSNNGLGFQRNVYINAYLGGTVWGQKKATITNCQYTATFKDSNPKNTINPLETMECYYNYTTPKYTKNNYKLPETTADVHYVFDGWDPALAPIKEDTTFTTKYKTEEHNWVDDKSKTNIEPTCTAYGTDYYICTVCNRTKSEQIDMLPHPYEYVKTVDPTCETDGYDLVSCPKCGKENRENIVKAPGHSWEVISKTEPTCTLSGSRKEECSVCHKTQTVTVPPLTHDYSVKVVLKEATCTSEGKETYACSREKCNSYDPAYNGKEGKTTSALGHIFLDDGWEEYEPATCEVPGKERRYCQRDRAHYEEREIKKLGHEYDETKTITVDPTCTKEGYSYHPCIHTGCTSVEIIEGSVKNPLGHDDGEWKVVSPETCTQDGTEKCFCTRCKEVLESRKLTKTGHNFSELEREIPATCLENEKKVMKCVNPGCKETQTVEVAGTVLGHEFLEENYKSNNDADCFNDGTKTAKCTRCEVVNTITDAGTKLTHEFKTYSVFKEATCTDDEKLRAFCEYGCGTADYKTNPKTALGHDVDYRHDEGSETCVSDGTKSGDCKRCGAKGVTVIDVGTKLNHKFTNYVYDEGSETCSKNGTETAKCEYDSKWHCGATDTRTTSYDSKHPHTYRPEDYTSNNDGTCLHNGTMSAYCAECHIAKSTVEEPNSKRDHYIANWISDGNATCTEDGTKHGKCAYGCGVYEETDVPDVGSALGHWFRDYAYTSDGNATCTEDGTRTAVCERDGCDATDTVTDVGSALGHDWSEWEFIGEKPDCTKGGTMERHCLRSCCIDESGKALVTDTKEVSATAHDYKWIVIEKTDAEGNPLPADCTRGYSKIKECTVCKTRDESSLTEVPGGAHHFVVSENVEATCTEDGRRVVSCDVCGFVESTVVLPAKGHLNTYLDEETVREATCKDEGYTGDYRCIECDEIVKSGEVVPVSDVHTFTTYVETTPATCTVNARETAVCSVCENASDEREVPGSALGHSFTDYVSNGDATCTGVETQTAVCDREGCDATDVIKKYGTALGHDWSDWTTITEASCRAPGKAERHCLREGCSISVTKVLRQLSHTESEWIVDKEPTCVSEGHRYKKCTGGCGYTFAEEVLPKVDHKFEVTECTATCIDDGFSTFVCSVCGEEKKGEVVPALGHDWSGEWVVTKEPTCTRKGKETLKCTRCEKTQTRDIDALGHKVVVDPAVPATCTEDGLTEGSHCERCGKVIVAQEKVVKPHFDGDGDGKCDECGKEIKHSTDLNCNCICHKQYWLMKLVYKILRFFWKMFKIGHGCDCGAIHY